MEGKGEHVGAESKTTEGLFLPMERKLLYKAAEYYTTRATFAESMYKLYKKASETSKLPFYTHLSAKWKKESMALKKEASICHQRASIAHRLTSEERTVIPKPEYENCLDDFRKDMNGLSTCGSEKVRLRVVHDIEVDRHRDVKVETKVKVVTTE